MSVEAPERIWIEADDECPYFYEAHELHDVEQDVIEYVRSDLVASLSAENERLKQEIAATQEKLIRANDELIQRNSKALSRSEVDAIRDQALEEAAAMCEEPRRFHDGSEIVMPSGKAYASAIRKLKSGGGQPR